MSRDSDRQGSCSGGSPHQASDSDHKKTHVRSTATTTRADLLWLTPQNGGVELASPGMRVHQHNVAIQHANVVVVGGVCSVCCGVCVGSVAAQTHSSPAAVGSAPQSHTAHRGVHSVCARAAARDASAAVCGLQRGASGVSGVLRAAQRTRHFSLRQR